VLFLERNNALFARTNSQIMALAYRENLNSTFIQDISDPSKKKFKKKEICDLKKNSA